MAPKAKVLVVEDNIDEAKLVKMILEPEGYEVVTALNGKEGWEKVGEEKPDLIILDIMMPELDGFAFCSRLRSNRDYQDIPVVLVTAVAKHIQETRYPLDGIMRADADEYLEKPIKPETLLETISKLLKKKS